ncbi:MAG: hypothetical protein M1838_000356 [Thelocarpon superellum]|nr:MAG: hypothetical protein M1838_000356 [Thelocarpon superellum]
MRTPVTALKFSRQVSTSTTLLAPGLWLKFWSGSSDSDLHEIDTLVPSCDAILDNSKTLGFHGGSSGPDRLIKERDAWNSFRYEILRLAHTLKLKGWRSVPLDRASEIEVTRLSGALTNAVYLVFPPLDFRSHTTDVSEEGRPRAYKKPPQKLLLRIYGPQVDELIDRDYELQVLRRLARQRIGPRLLGTFLNGRFEQFLNAQTLTARDLRAPDTSKQIAKRMRELHDGIELLKEERDAGPFVWRNWDNWVDKVDPVARWLDKQVNDHTLGSTKAHRDAWKDRGFVCGVEWPVFRDTVRQYRTWMENRYGGPGKVREKLVFAHNDTQYGNLLRLQPSGESPLLLPANEHKQLVVIDFEYASANLPGLEFANHFTEWCYDYTDPKRPYALNHGRYPTPEEQRRFVRAYVEHTPFQTRPATSPSSPPPSTGPSNSISAFMLDSRASAPQIIKEEAEREQSSDDAIKEYLHDTQLWRLANSAQWIAWGILQAQTGMPDEGLSSKDAPNPCPTDHTEPSGTDYGPDASLTRVEEESRDEFDYLSYAQERALFFWGDIVRLGIRPARDLPAELLPKLKIVDH